MIYEGNGGIVSPSLLEKHTDGSGSRVFVFLFSTFLSPVLSFLSLVLSFRVAGECPRAHVHFAEFTGGGGTLWANQSNYCAVESPFEDNQTAMVRIDHTGLGRGLGVGTGVHGPMYIMSHLVHTLDGLSSVGTAGT